MKEDVKEKVAEAEKLKSKAEQVNLEKSEEENERDELSEFPEETQKGMLLRSERLALLQTTFPPIHWASMALLGGSIVVAFLIESDEQARPPHFSLHHSPPSST